MRVMEFEFKIVPYEGLDCGIVVEGTITLTDGAGSLLLCYLSDKGIKGLSREAMKNWLMEMNNMGAMNEYKYSEIVSFLDVGDLFENFDAEQISVWIKREE